MLKTPEHEKLIALDGRNNTVGDFLQWLEDAGYTICDYHQGPEGLGGYHSGDYMPIRQSKETLVAGYFNIDQDALEKEKRAMLDDLRKGSNGEA